jgi:hypothetical protein
VVPRQNTVKPAYGEGVRTCRFLEPVTSTEGMDRLIAMYVGGYHLHGSYLQCVTLACMHDDHMMHAPNSLETGNEPARAPPYNVVLVFKTLPPYQGASVWTKPWKISLGTANLDLC